MYGEKFLKIKNNIDPIKSVVLKVLRYISFTTVAVVRVILLITIKTFSS